MVRTRQGMAAQPGVLQCAGPRCVVAGVVQELARDRVVRGAVAVTANRLQQRQLELKHAIGQRAAAAAKADVVGEAAQRQLGAVEREAVGGGEDGGAEADAVVVASRAAPPPPDDTSTALALYRYAPPRAVFHRRTGAAGEPHASAAATRTQPPGGTLNGALTLHTTAPVASASVNATLPAALAAPALAMSTRGDSSAASAVCGSSAPPWMAPVMSTGA